MADAKKFAERAMQRVADKGVAAGIEYLFSATNSAANKPIRRDVLALVSPELRDAWHAYEAAKEKMAKEREEQMRISREQAEAKRKQNAEVQYPVLEAACRGAYALSLEEKISAAVDSERDEDRGEYGEEFPWEDPTIGLSSALVTFVKNERDDIEPGEFVLNLASALLSEEEAIRVAAALGFDP